MKDVWPCFASHFACDAYCQVSISTPSKRDLFMPLVMPLLQALGDLVTAGRQSPQAMLQLADGEALDDNVLHLAVEVICCG